MGVAHAVVYMMSSMVAVQWYWHEGGGQEASQKTTPDDAIRWSLWTTIRYHMGTIFFGSFAIALMQLCRILLRLLEKRLRGQSGRSAGRDGDFLLRRVPLHALNALSSLSRNKGTL